VRAFVTGGSGFVGQELISALRARGDEVRALARSDRAEAAVRARGAEPVRGDLEDQAALARGVSGCDVVFHAAAKVEMWGRREDFVRCNVVGTDNVLHAAQAHGVPRFVHVSTEAVLVGGPPIVRADESWPRPRRPLGLYPVTKGQAEECVLAANSPALATMIVRPRFIWGKGDTTVLPRMIEMVKQGKFSWIGGHHLTSTCHVRNVCEGALLAAEKGQGGEIYFLTDGDPLELRAFVTSLMATEGVAPGARSVPFWLARTAAWMLEGVWRGLSLSGEPPIARSAVRLFGSEVTVSDAKARRELGYRAEVTIEAGLAEMRAAAPRA
jgi:nucleoside-diphosphate-sugar epimerase